MNAQSRFWALVKHDLKMRRQRSMRVSGRWRMAYFIAVALFVVIFTSLEGRHVTFDLSFAWYFTFGLPFMVFGLSTGRIVQEWKNGTAGWWLTLPMSRMQLVMAKFLSSLLHTVFVLACIYCVVAILGLYTMTLNGTLTTVVAGHFLLVGLMWMAGIVCVSPIVAAIGALFGIIIQSTIRQALPLFWITVGGLWWLLFNHNGNFLHMTSTGNAVGVTLSPLLICLVVASWLVAYILILVASRVLDRFVAV